MLIGSGCVTAAALDFAKDFGSGPTRPGTETGPSRPLRAGELEVGLLLRLARPRSDHGPTPASGDCQPLNDDPCPDPFEYGP